MQSARSFLVAGARPCLAVWLVLGFWLGVFWAGLEGGLLARSARLAGRPKGRPICGHLIKRGRKTTQHFPAETWDMAELKWVKSILCPMRKREGAMRCGACLGQSWRLSIQGHPSIHPPSPLPYPESFADEVPAAAAAAPAKPNTMERAGTAHVPDSWAPLPPSSSAAPAALASALPPPALPTLVRRRHRRYW